MHVGRYYLLCNFINNTFTLTYRYYNPFVIFHEDVNAVMILYTLQ